MTRLPRYPIYVPSKGRSHAPLTIRFLQKDGVPFRVVVERDERKTYAKVAGAENVLVLPKSGQGLTFARNWIKDHATSEGHERHWQLDDNMRMVRRVVDGHRLPCASGPAFAACEDFVDRYQNVAIAGMNYTTFFSTAQRVPPFQRNLHVYSCSLVLNEIPHRWRLRYNDDTDICLQVLADGWCTVLFNAFLVDKMRTMTVTGGNTTDLYQGDGRLEMARSLERMWPGVVRTYRRFGRPQHYVDWKRFTTPLRLRDGVDLDALDDVDEYGMVLRAVKDVQSPRLRRLLEERGG